MDAFHRHPKRPARPQIALHATDKNKEASSTNTFTLPVLALVSFFYWYWLVFGAAAHEFALPGIPEWLPLTPGWPPSPQDLEPVLEDSYHFFYLSELLGNTDAPYAPATRLAVFNFAEAWIFAMLPALWADRQRLSQKYILLALWAAVGINLTNAFLAPYLCATAAFVTPEPPREKNRFFSVAFGSIASLVALYATKEVVTATSIQEWSDFCHLVQTDRTYLGFCVDLLLFSCFQPYLLQRVNGDDVRPLDKVPFVGLMAWLFRA